ncbi:MAG: four helix bundle protein [Melioribacteraceae bacterium]|nr:four helix bundle protein [Melioribacteraceae bacterium]
MKNFKQMKVWEKAHQLTLETYRITKEYPKDELFGLVSQMRRSASSIATNIAEGCGKNSDADFARFIVISMGSANELEYQFILSHDLKYINQKQFNTLDIQINEIKKMLVGLHKKLKANS